jgi:DNA gyrase subunit A
MIFSNKGKMYRLLVNDVPVGTNTSAGQSIKSLIAMDTDEIPVIMYSIYRDTDAKYVLFVTKNGLVKKTTLDEYVKTKKKTGIAAITIKEGDELAAVSLIKDEPLVLVTSGGMSIKFDSSEVAPTSRATSGIKGITLNKNDCVITALPVRNGNDELAIFSANGLSKKFNLSELPNQKRAGKGLMCYKPSESTGDVVSAVLVDDTDNVLILGDRGSICISAQEIPSLSRASIGNQVIKNSKINSVSKV